MWPSSLKRPVGLFLWLAFASGVLVTYFRQIWTAFNLGPEQWVRNNLSLSTALKPGWHLFKSKGIAFSLPAFSEAMERNLLAFWGAVLVLLCAGILGTLLLRLMAAPFQNWREAVLYRISAGLGVFSYLCLGLAVLSQYRPATVRFLVAVITAGGVTWLICNRLSLHQASGSKPRSGKIGPRSNWEWAWITVSLLAILTALIGALAPETEFDALRYHLWLPKLWLENGSPVDLVNEYVALYPLAWELLFGAALVIGNSVAPKLLHFAALPLTSLLVYQITRRFVPKASPWLSVAIFATVPTVLWEATTAYNDLALAFHVGLAIYALLGYLTARRWQWLALAALNMGFALATKNLALIVLLPSSAGLAGLLWLEERSWRSSLVRVALFAGISLLIPFPWYLRSWLASGNPVFPDLYHVFGAFPVERWNDITEQGLAAFKDGFGYPRTPLNLLLLPWNITIHAARFGGSLGPIFLVLIPGFLWHQFRTAPISWLLAFAVGYILLWVSPASSFQMRFLIAIVPILAVLASLAFTAFMQQFTRPGWQRVIAPTVITGLLLLNFPPFTSLHESDRSASQGWLTHVIHELPLSVVVGAESEEAYLGAKIPSFQAWQYINRNLPADALVLTFSDGDHYYSERRRLWSQSPLGGSVLQKTAGGNGEEAIQDFRRIGVGYILFDKRQTDGADPGASILRETGQASASLKLLYEDRFFALYRIV
jgi:hypothetical protein